MAYERIITRIDVIESRLVDLDEWLPHSIDDYLRDKKCQAAIERTLQVIIQASIDISIQLLKYFKMEPPGGERSIINSLKPKIKTIEMVGDMKKFRNFLVNIYGHVDSRLVFENSGQIRNDIPLFLEEVQSILKKK